MADGGAPTTVEQRIDTLEGHAADNSAGRVAMMAYNDLHQVIRPKLEALEARVAELEAALKALQGRR